MRSRDNEIFCCMWWTAIKPLLWNTNWFVNPSVHNSSNSIQCDDCSDVLFHVWGSYLYLPLLTAGFVHSVHFPWICVSCWHSTNSPDVASSVRQDARGPLTDLTEAGGRHNPLHKTLPGIYCMTRNFTEAKEPHPETMLVLILCM